MFTLARPRSASAAQRVYQGERENIDHQQLHFGGAIAFHTCARNRQRVAKRNKCTTGGHIDSRPALLRGGVGGWMGGGDGMVVVVVEGGRENPAHCFDVSAYVA